MKEWILYIAELGGAEYLPFVMEEKMVKMG